MNKLPPLLKRRFLQIGLMAPIVAALLFALSWWLAPYAAAIVVATVW